MNNIEITGTSLIGKKYYHRYLANGILGILNYPNLHNILGRFENFKETEHDKNIFLCLASDSQSDKKGIRDNAKKILSDLNEFLGNNHFEKIKVAQKNSIMQRMCSFKNNENKTIYYELQLWKSFKENTNIKYVGYEDKNNDFTLKIDNTEINFEFTMLGYNEKLKCLNDSFSAVAKKIVSELPNDKLIKIFVNPLTLNDFEDKKIVLMINQIYKDFKAIKPLILAKKGALRIPNCELKCSLFEIEKKYYYPPDMFERIEILKKDNISYLKATTIDTLQELCICDCHTYDAIEPYVEITIELAWPTPLGDKLLNLDKNQLYSRITRKIEDKQLSRKKNPLILIKYNFSIMGGYTIKCDIDPVEPIKNIIKKTVEDAFKNFKEKEILGVLFFENSAENMLLIKNPNAKISEELMTNLKKITEIIEF